MPVYEFNYSLIRMPTMKLIAAYTTKYGINGGSGSKKQEIKLVPDQFIHMQSCF